MSTAGWLILLFFAAVIVVIAYKLLQTDYNESGSEITPKPPTPEPKSDPVQKEQPNFVTIYEFHPAKNVKICRCCDGENPMDAPRCGICGEEIDA